MAPWYVFPLSPAQALIPPQPVSLVAVCTLLSLQPLSHPLLRLFHKRPHARPFSLSLSLFFPHLPSGLTMVHPPTMTNSPPSSVTTLGLGNTLKRTPLFPLPPSLHPYLPHSYFRKFENYTPDPRFPLVDHALRGSHGPVTVGYHAYIWHGSPLFVQASVNAGVPFTPDFTTSNGTLGTNKVRLHPLSSSSFIIPPNRSVSTSPFLPSYRSPFSSDLYRQSRSACIYRSRLPHPRGPRQTQPQSRHRSPRHEDHIRFFIRYPTCRRRRVCQLETTCSRPPCHGPQGNHRLVCLPPLHSHSVSQSSSAAEQFILPKSSCSLVSVLHLSSKNTTFPSSSTPPAWVLISLTTSPFTCISKTSSAFPSTTWNHTT